MTDSSPTKEPNAEPTSLMTPAQHRQLARLLRLNGHPEKALLHEQLARANGRLSTQEVEPRKKAPRERG